MKLIVSMLVMYLVCCLVRRSLVPPAPFLASFLALFAWPAIKQCVRPIHTASFGALHLRVVHCPFLVVFSVWLSFGALLVQRARLCHVHRALLVSNKQQRSNASKSFILASACPGPSYLHLQILRIIIHNNKNQFDPFS